MTETSPGVQSDNNSPSSVRSSSGDEANDGSSPRGQPSSLPVDIKDDHFTTGHSMDSSPKAFYYQNGLQFRIRSSKEKCPSFSYATLPGVTPTPMEWRMCVVPDSDVAAEHVTYYKLTNSDKSLSTVMAEHSETNLLGLVIINSIDNHFLSADFISGDMPSTPPLYVVSSGEGERLQKFVEGQVEGNVQIKVLVESAVDSMPVVSTQPAGRPSHVISSKTTSQSKVEPAAGFNLHEELKRIIVNKKEKEKIHFCANQPQFQFIFSCFHNYESQPKKDAHDKAISKVLDNFTDDMFSRDFLFYLLLCYRFITYSDVYSTGSVVSNYLIHCIEKIETCSDPQSLADVLLAFVDRGDFSVQFNHGPKSDVKVFQLLFNMTKVMLGRSNRLQELKKEATKLTFNVIYRRMLWICLYIFFGLQVKVEPVHLSIIWESELLTERVQKELAFSDEIVKEFAKGFELLKALKLPESVCFDSSIIGVFMNPLRMRMLYISHITMMINACQIYFVQGDFFFTFLPPMRAHYQLLLNDGKTRDWRRYGSEGTKFGLYKEALKFLEYIFNYVMKLNKDDVEDNKRAYIIEAELTKWLELLVKSVNMLSDDAVEYFKLLHANLTPAEFSKRYKKAVTAVIRDRGMASVKELSVPQFYKLFKELYIWSFQFVEEFLNSYNVPMSFNLKDPSWKLMLEEITYRFSDARCKACIVKLIERIGKAYKSGKRQNDFVMDLMKMNTPELLLVQSAKEYDPNVEQMFIDLVRTFIQKYGLRDVILGQVATIMAQILPDSHMHSLILAALQKEIVPDSKMIERINTSNHLKLVISASVTAACNSLSTFPQLSIIDKFYWHFIASCCAHVQPSADNLSKLSSYLYVIEKLSKIYQDYCGKVINAVIHEVPQKFNQTSHTDVKEYFKWIIKMQSILIHWQSKFIHNEYNYDDIFSYASNLQNITILAKLVQVQHLAYSSDEITKVKENYSKVYAILCSLLVKNSKEAGWCTLVDMLYCYGVRLSQTIQTMLDTHVVLPGRSSKVITVDVQQRLNQANDELEPEMILLFYKSMTWKVLQELSHELTTFLQPILAQLDFLVYFHVHSCEMFSRHLKSQIAKLSHSDDPVDEGGIMLTIPMATTQESSTDPDEKLLQLSTALQSTKDFILSLIKGTAKSEEIFVGGSLEEMQKFDADSEFKIMCGYPEFQEVAAANEEGKEGIKHMLELFQYSQQISLIPEVCAQYHLNHCLSDPKLKELEGIVKSVETAEDRAKVTGQIANIHMKKIWKVLNFAGSASVKKCLKIFPAVANCAEFYQFIRQKGFASDRTAFRSQVELITAQLQHEDYNETVLNHLMPAFNYITPFLDTEQSLDELLDKIARLFKDGIGFGRDPRKDFCQLETVNSNITMIQLWFSRTEGDTLENVSKELDCIMRTGHFQLIIKPKRIAGTSNMDMELSSENNSEVLLHYEPTREFVFQRNRLKTLCEIQDDTSLLLPMPSFGRQSSHVMETWNNDQIDDFVRKLGFLEAQSTDVEQPVKLFQQLNQTAQKFYRTLLKLRDLGHPEYVMKTEAIHCSAKLEDAESLVTDAERKLKEWRVTIREMLKSYDKLLFFSVSKVLSLNDILMASDSLADEMIQEIGFLFENSPEAIRKLKTAIKSSAGGVDNLLSFSSATPVAHVGKYLEQLCSNLSVSEHFLYSRSQPSTSIRGKSLLSFQEIVHFAPNYDNGQLLRLLIQIYNGVPESYEVFHCDADSSEEDLKLFLYRTSKFRYRTFTVLEVNKLPYKLQELILHHHSHEAEQTMESAIRLNYIETANSILHEMPWVVVKEYKESGPELTWGSAKDICDKYVNRRNVNYHLQLVYGCAGDGKTHYVENQLLGFESDLIIAINESFSPLKAILKLRSLPQNECCKIFFNFTIVSSTDFTIPEEKIKRKRLMNTLAWFFFKLLVFEYVEDSETGMAFRLPGGHRWRIFVEVPSQPEVDVNNNLEWICNEIPIFHLLGNPILIEKDCPYDIDPSVQLVCKYLYAYESRADVKQGINKLYIENGPPVMFGNRPDLSKEECHTLLKKYMPPHVTKNKVLQRLFIKYMERRCIFMERFPGFSYNSGCGTQFEQQVSERELRTMVHDRILVKLGKQYYSNTSQLGEVLMETMLQEVSEFCKVDIQKNWATQAHRQLIYGEGTIQLITLKSEELGDEKTKKFAVLGIEIPTRKDLLTRKKLDFYLSSALGVPLQNERLKDIDEAKYVLTLDYAVKMLNIHERRECGIPVIIEGETGVGKTALINMLSKLWNHALTSEWRAMKGRIVEMLFEKSLDLENSNLKRTLEQLNSNLQYGKELDPSDNQLSEEDLIPLTETTHSSHEDIVMPYFEFVNRRLLEMTKSGSVFELLDIDVEARDNLHYNQRSRLFSIGNRETSIATHLIDEAMNVPSAQATAKLLSTLLNADLIPMFHKLNIHAALSPKEIRDFFIPIVKMAKHLLKVYETKQLRGMKDPPVVAVFLDEVNTSSCMGLFKEMLVDKSFEGEPLPANIFLIAACNPHRGNSLAVHASKDEHKAETWVRGSYYVQKLHPTLRFLMWDYGSLNDEQESAYINAKMTMVNEEFDIVQNIVFSELVVDCQKLIRKYAYEQLKQFGLEASEARLRATSCVSQRDIQRVFTFYGWILKTYEMLQLPSSEGVTYATMTMGDMPAACITKHPMIRDRLNPEEMRQRALLVALGLVYYMRLDSIYRAQFVKVLDKKNFAVKFHEAFTQEMDFYTNELSLPTGIAKTEALKENLFATIICTVTKTPLIIVGAPGSSKTLSFNLTISNLKGPESKQKLFRNTDVFKSLDPHYYQCSRRTTSTEIETVFQRAINRQKSHKSFSMPIRCVVFMDEAGLPEESHESLKVLHYHLDQQEVAFVAITNHILDAAKTNRAVSLFRPTASQKDLETLAKGCLCANPERPPPDLVHDLDTIVKFCPAYYAIMKDEHFEKFFGLRDFIHFINYIRRERNVDISPELVLQSLERNFNGAEGFEHICSVFLGELGAKLDDLKLKRRTIIEILSSSLEDKPYSHYHPLSRTISKVMSPSPAAASHDDTQNEVRYKLIIDPSEDESIAQLLFMFGILKRENTRTYMCSDFLGDGQLQKINTIAAIRHSAIAGHTVILSQTDDIHESFYDLFNQHFRRIDDPEGGPRYFTNIAIGAHLKPSRVDQNFQCIVIVKESEIKNTPAPFLNRFEKYFISHRNLLNLVVDQLPPCLKVIINVVHKKVEAFYSLLNPDSFYGRNEETVCSLLLSILPRPGHHYQLLSSQSFVPIDNGTAAGASFISSSFTVTTGSSSNKVLLLQNVVRCLHEFGGFCYMESSVEELEHDANSIITLLATAGSEFSGVAEKLGSCDVTTISQWITHALDLVYTGDSPPDIDVIDYDTCDDVVVKTLGASDGACMVTAVIAQWLVRFMCKKLMQLMTPEAAIVKRKCIPISYLETYLNHQTHFSIKELIKRQSKLLNECDGSSKVATKFICYTRSTPSIHQLPAVYTSTSQSSNDELQQSHDHDIEDLICEKVDELYLCKLSSVSSQTSFKLHLQAFVASQRQTVFVLVVNMQETSRLIVNHIRIMIEEVEHANIGEIEKLFVILLHFPAMMFYDPCYPSLFLCGWDHYYLDAIDQANEFSLVDTKEWFRLSCLSTKEEVPLSVDDAMCRSLLALLNKPESILVIASRILLTIDTKTMSLDSSDIATKVDYLKKLLFHKKVAEVLCIKFKSYWRPSVMGDHLEQAAKFSRSRESTLNVSDSVDSMYRSAFFNFIAYMLCQISKSHNLDMLFSKTCDNATLDLFLKLLDAHPVPKLAEIKAFNNTWDCRVHTAAGRTGYVPQFPFFKEISDHISNMVELGIAEISENVDILQEKQSSGSQSKEQMFELLYEHLCDKVSATKGEKMVGEKYMNAIAINEMRSDEMIWQKYYNDFIYQYLHLSAAPNSLEHQLVQLTFANVLKKFHEMKAIAAHCYMYLYQLHLGKVVASLKPLGQLHELKAVEESLYPRDPEYSILATLQTSKTALGSSNISKFVIDSLFAALVDVLYNKKSGQRLTFLQKWFSSYRDVMSMVPIKNMLNAALNERLKTQCHVMEVTFLVLLSFHSITVKAAECAGVLATHLCTKHFTDKFQLIGNAVLNLEKVVTSFNAMLHSPQFSEVTSNLAIYQHILEGTFAHFFPDTASAYSKEDIEFFVTFANDQSALRELVEALDLNCQPENLISLSKFKFHLDRILSIGWSKSGTKAKPLNFYKQEICVCVGETILRQYPEATPSKYIPTYLQQSSQHSQNPLMQQKLTHLYFHTVLEKLQTSQCSPSQLVKMISDTDKKLSEVASKAEMVIAFVERQALLEELLQAVVSNFDVEDKSKLSNLLAISDKLNLLINDQSHYDILLMYLMKKCHGPQGVLTLLAEKHRTCWEHLNCLKLIKEKLKNSPPSTSHQFPFIVGSPTAKHRFSTIYREICELLLNIADGSSPQKTKRFLQFVDSIIHSNDKSFDGRSTVRMMIWFCVYYEFYRNKKSSPILIEFFRVEKDVLSLCQWRLSVLNCFLDTKNMINQPEVPNPLNPNVEVLEYTREGKIKPKQPPSNVPKSDPIWEFFNPRNAREDPSDVSLRHALANMIGVVIGLPSRITHLWYHMFTPKDIEDSYLTGFMYPNKVKKGGLMYDCGCELNEDGHYGRADYVRRDTLSLHSWYLLLWCNFGAFCVGLLTQPDSLKEIKGHLLSDWMSIRHYCMTQLRTVWLHMRTNMSLGDEERSFFIMRSMHQLFTLFQEDTFPQPKGRFVTLEMLSDYEKAWHALVYKPSKSNLKDELETHSSHSVWALPILKDFRILEQRYPHPATENDFMKSLVAVTEENDCNHSHLFALHQFTLQQQRLQVGGALLSDLVEFYQWIHTHMSYLLTYERAKQITIGNVISLSARRYSQEFCDHLTKLFSRTIDKYNEYLKLNGGVVGGESCNRALKPTDVHQISNNTPLIKLVSLEDTTKNDWLYIVLMDVIGNHNAFLTSVCTHAVSSDYLNKYLPASAPELYPTEVTSQSGIVPSSETDGKQFIKLISSHHVYDGIQSVAVFDLEQLEQDVVKLYIAGKPLIVTDDSFRTVFRFKNSPHEATLPGNNPGCAIDLSAIAQELPSSYKESLREETRRTLEYHFRAATYHTFTEVVNGLRAVMGHLIQDIIQRNNKTWDPTLNVKLFDYLKKFFNKDHQVFDEIGIQNQNVTDIQRRLLGDVEMKRLFKCLGLFVGWLQGGLYDFNSLPFTVFKHLESKDVEALRTIHVKYSSTGMDQLLNDFDEFEKSLNHAENHLLSAVDIQSSIIDTLVELKLCDTNDKFTHLIPKSILGCHYVHFRMTLRKIKLQVKTMVHSQQQNSSIGKDKWNEIIGDLWKYLSHFQDQEEDIYDENCLKFDCVNLQFGDGEESDSESETWLHQNISDTEDSLVEVDDKKNEILHKIEQDPDLKEAIMAKLGLPKVEENLEVRRTATETITPSISPLSVTAASMAPSLVALPSAKAMGMTSDDLCEWLKAKKIADKYIECFREDDVDGTVLATYTDEDLEGMGISQPHIRKKIMAQFRRI